MTLTVGQKLWFVPSYRHGTEHEVTVERVGRKWAYLNRRTRINADTLVADGGEYASPGTCYLSREAYEEYKRTLAMWHMFHKAVRDQWNLPRSLTQAQIQQAADVLGFVLKSE